MLEDELKLDLTLPVKERKKKRLPRVPKEILPIKCSDKVGCESWNEDRAKNIGNFPSPSRILLLGPCGVGKSCLIKNLILQQRPRFQEVYLVHADAFISKEYDDLKPTEKMVDIPDIDFWDRDGPHIKRAIIIDDLEFTAANKTRLQNLALLMRYVSTHKGLTVYLGHQSFFSVPIIARKMCNCYVIWRPRARTEISLIEDRVGMPKGALKELFTTVATKHFDSICVDMTKDSPAPLRLNIFNPIEMGPKGQDAAENDKA